MQDNLRYFSHELTNNKRYEKARAHSRLVAFLRKALPAIAFSALMLFVVLSYVGTIIPEEVVVESAAIENGQIIMNSPILAGQNTENLPYRMKALRAIQKIGENSVVTLEKIEAELPMNKDDVARITAELGIFDQKQNFLTFTKPLEITTSTGISAHFEAAQYDIDSSAFKSNEKVDITFNGGTISSNGLEIAEGGKSMSFTGDVKLIISPDRLREGAN